jgi:HlyD family secretion protein
MGWTLSRRVWLVLGVAALLVVALLYVNSRRPAARVAVVQVERENLSSSIATNGKVEPTSPFPLRAKFDGFVEQVAASEGQTVKSGQLLLVMDDRDVRAQLSEAQAQLAQQQDDLRAAQAGGRPDQAARIAGDLRSAEAQRDLLARQQEALTKLVAEKAATPDELERNGAALERSNADVEQLRKAKQEFGHQAELDDGRLTLLVEHSRAQVVDLEDKVSSSRVVAPVSGTVFSLPAHARDFVHTGDLLANVADLREVRVRAYIDEPELGQVQPNQDVVVTWDALPDRTWTGRTETVPKQVVARGARNVGELLCTISNPGMELIPNTSVDVRIDVNMTANALVVPRGAVQIEGAKRYVYRVDGNRLHRTEVHVGISNAAKIEILSGVQEGDTLALPGEAALKNNVVVSVVRPE